MQRKMGAVEYMELVTYAAEVVWKVYTKLNSRCRKSYAIEYMHTEA